jgi:ribonuclease P protein component
VPDGAAPRGRRSRVTRSGDFDSVYRRGKSAAGRHLVVYAFDRGEGDSPRLGLSVGKRVGGAVERNRVKRVLREEFSRIQAELTPGVDYVVIARPGVHEYVEERGSRALGERLQELADKVTRAAAA